MSSEDFFNPDNLCGQSLLNLASKGSAILAELQRLSSNIPKLFYENSPEYHKYSKILYQFEYLNNIDEFEDAIQLDMDLVELDSHFKDTYVDLLERFYGLFESIYIYYSDILTLLEEIFEGVFMQYSFENLLQNTEGRRLVTEVFYIYGVMLMLTDNLIPGPIREKIIIAFYRYKGGLTAITNINEVCKLFKATGYLPREFTPDNKELRPEYYPEDYFARYTFDEQIIEAIVISVKDSDIYNNLPAYIKPEHRSFALAQQGSQLFILLFFVPDILIEKSGKMREIVDKHFQDNWVITYYLGYYVDLTIQWRGYKAAFKALRNVLEKDYIEELSQYFKQSLIDCYKKCQEFLIDGVLTEEYTLEKQKNLMNCVRDCNTTLKWLMLHMNTDHSELREIVSEELQIKDILSLLLIASKFESKLQQMFENLIATKSERWDTDKEQCADRMGELSEYFGGQRGLGKIQSDESFKVWFAEIKSQIDKLTYGDEVYTSRKINQMIKALEDIEQYQALNSNYTIRQYLQETRNDLKHMSKIGQVKQEILTHISLISDISYMWNCLPQYIPIMQEKIKKYPQTALLLKATFMKLSCILNTPMVRILQAKSQDINSVSKYYSQELMNFVKEVLQIIPQQVFEVLEEVIYLLTDSLQKLPPKFNKSDFKNMVQYEERFQVASHCYRISLLTESILSMEKYLVGVIEVNPKDILEEGIRKELIKLIGKILNKGLKFKQGTVEEFFERLKNLSENLEGFKMSIEYIQDLISSYGLKIFHEEFDRLISCYIDMEQNAFLTGALDFEGMLYDDDIPMPSMEEMKQFGAVNFMGRLVQQMLKITNGASTVYVENSLGFYELNTGREILSLKTLGLLYRCIGVPGMSGIDQFLGFQISTTMKSINKILKKNLNQQASLQLRKAFDEVKNLTAFNPKHQQIYEIWEKNLGPVIKTMIYPLQKIGQMILLRKLICLQLQLMAKIGSKRLYLCLENLNNGILNDVCNRLYDEAMDQEDLIKENEVIYETSQLFSYIGLTDPFKKVYITPEYIEAFPFILFLLTKKIIPHMDYDKRINCLIRKDIQQKKKTQEFNPLDVLQPNYVLYGILGMLNQYHPHNKQIYMGFLAHQIKSQLNNQAVLLQQQQQNEKKKQPTTDIMGDLLINITYFDQLTQISGDAKGTSFNPMIPIELLNGNLAGQQK